MVSYLLALSIPTEQISEIQDDPSDDTIITDLSNQIIKEGGYVHPSLQLSSPAPCGADRGVIFGSKSSNVDDSDVSSSSNEDRPSSIWLRVPFSYQLTRDLALDTLTPLIPNSVLDEAPLDTLDDGALLVLLLAHLRGMTTANDKWHPFLASLPDDPGCGWWVGDSIDNGAKRYEHMIPNEVITSSRGYVSRVSNGMAKDYGPYLANNNWPKKWKEAIDKSKEQNDGIINAAARAIEWSLCIVSSRGTAASPTLGGGSIRLVPFADMFNHNLHSIGFMELTKKDVNNGGTDQGSFVGSFEVRQMKDTTVLEGEEITVDYNLVGYTPEDWFLSHGFIPSEVLERNRRSEL